MIDRVEFELPATSANLGPGFDAIALAMNLKLRVTARRSSAFRITARGRNADICRRQHNNLMLSTYRNVMAEAGRPASPLQLTVRNEIPIGKGCGSSAAARIAGIALANHFGGLRWPLERILWAAAQHEGHADNVGACCLGGVVLTRPSSEGNEAIVLSVKLKSPARWPLILAIPSESLSTEKARQVLPTSYSRHDVVANLQNAMLLVAAFQSGDKGLLSSVLKDHVHEPYRAALCPLLPCLKPLAGQDGILGVALSGSGPSVLLFVDSETSVNSIRRRIRDALSRHGLKAELLATHIAAGSIPGPVMGRRR